MVNSSESPDGKEQAKTSSRSRTSARSQSENVTAASQESAAKPVTRRRTTTGSTRKSAAVPVEQDEVQAATTPAEVSPPATSPKQPKVTSRPDENGADATVRQPRAKATATSAQRPDGPEVQAQAPAQRPGGTETQAPAQRARKDDSPPPTQRIRSADVQAPAQRPGGTDLRTPTQRSSGPDTRTPAQRPGGTDLRTSAQRTGVPSSPMPRANTAGPNPNRVGGVSSRPGGTGPTGARPVGAPQTPAQRLGQPQRSSAHASPTAQRGTVTLPTRPAARPGNGNAPGGPARSGATVRPGGHGPQGATRPGARPGTAPQRSHERRTTAVKEKPTGPIAIPPQIVVKDLADLMQATPNEVIRGLIKHGVFASINQVVDYEKAALIAQEMGFEPSESAHTTAPAVRSQKGLSANEAMMASRHEDNSVIIPPVVTIMGHVDHGKTSLLDTIRKTKVAAGEAGGITQHIGAYQVEVNGKKITFLDTPGHEAFTAMRARGAQVTHIAIIVVAADDGVMPQTREAIDHARAAKVPIIIALNKIDKANANPDHVKQQLADIDVLIEEYGGDVVCVPVSARRGTGIDELLDMILLVAELQEIKANPDRPATGVIIEAKLEKSTGPTATVLIQQGTLKMGDNIVVGGLSGKVRAMFNDRGKRIQKAPPSMPVSILGLPEVPNAGDHLEVVQDERAARQKAQQVAEQRRDESMPLGQVSLDSLYMQMQEGNVKELNIVLKCDVQGSAEALKNSLSKIGDDNMKVRLIHEGIGNISETDVHLAAASGAVIIGFNVKADGASQREAQKEGVDIRYYNVIYKLIDDIQAALTGMLEPTYKEVIEGHAEVLQTFKAGKNMVIAGCRITDGKITRSAKARVTRNGEKVFDGKIASLRRGKDDVREVASGYECGIVLEDYNSLEVGDIIEAYAQERVKSGA